MASLKQKTFLSPGRFQGIWEPCVRDGTGRGQRPNTRTATGTGWSGEMSVFPVLAVSVPCGFARRPALWGDHMHDPSKQTDVRKTLWIRRGDHAPGTDHDRDRVAREPCVLTGTRPVCHKELPLRRRARHCLRFPAAGAFSRCHLVSPGRRAGDGELRGLRGPHEGCARLPGGEAGGERGAGARGRGASSPARGRAQGPGPEQEGEGFACTDRGSVLTGARGRALGTSKVLSEELNDEM